MSKLIVTVDSASNLPNVDTFGASDPYCIIEIKGLKNKTKVIDNELNPVWKERFEFDLVPALAPEDKLSVTVKDYENIGPDKLLGLCEISLKELAKGGKPNMEVNAPLQDANKRAIGATVKLSIAYTGKRKAVRYYDDAAAADGVRGTVVDQVESEPENDLLDEPDHGQHSGSRSKRHHRRRNVGGAAHRKTRAKLSNKPQDFQIRIKIVEARQLQGANISPVCRVTCYNQMKQTRIKKSTNSPYWGETFFFNFHVSPADLMEELVECGVFNSRRLRSDAMIGAFKFDLGMLYEEEGHAFLHKWLLLCDPEDPQGGAKGYLKICAVILGPGDEAPSFKQTSSADEDEDIEANLLRPAGVQLRPATFTLRVYRAEDLPKMDSELFDGVKKIFTGSSTKELVDPYLVFQFAGKEVRTETKYANNHPEWNEELHIGLQFPSMCERIKLQMFDWDRLTEDDVIGTAYIDISLISAQGESDQSSDGYLPTFGPAFINFYGSPREFSELGNEFDALNEGKGEGVAYRGRILAELRTDLGETPDRSKCAIADDQITKAQKFMRRRKYRLHAAFGSASMISEVDAPIEFEISIGNYGNKLDDSVPPCASTTQPTNAVFDGVHYYFLPWGKTKPCAVVESQWEDIGFRLQAVNFLNRIVERLDANIERINVAVKAKLPQEEQAQFVIAALDDLILMCNKDLPAWSPGQSPVNELDLYLSSLREHQLQSIRAAAAKLRAECTSVEEAVNELDSFRSQIRAVAIEPQNSFPDVVIWMLCANKRIAYYRMPAYEVLYCDNEDFRGKFCGKVQNVLFKPPTVKQNDESRLEIPALVRLTVWLGHEKDESEWHKMQREGSLSVLAETYENEWYFVKWIKSGPGRPAWSDAAGRVEIVRDKLTPPNGWRWERDWFISPELSLYYDKDAGHSEFLEDVYVNEARMPGAAWQDAKVKFTDVKGDPSSDMDKVKLPDGWRWKDGEDWKVDFNRPCDEEGWEYTVEATMGGYVPVEKMFHMCRRRRFIRPRVLISAGSPVEESQKQPDELADPEKCWEYAIGFGQKFHANKRPVDLVRRRRWHRKMLPVKPGAPPCFFNLKEAAGDNKAMMAAPRMVLLFDKSRRWQLRAYVFQARDLLAGDQTGLSDPYARVSFHTRSGVTERIDKTLCPTWDQTLIFDSIEAFSDPHSIAENAPPVVVEIFDYDQLGEDEFLGRALVQPMVKLSPTDKRRPVLQWHSITKGSREGGELLAAFELFLLTGEPLPPTPPKRGGDLFVVPDGVKPVLQRTGIEILSWGVRNMQTFQLMSVTSPSVEFEIGGHLAVTDVIVNTKRNPNFQQTLQFMDVMLPKETLYLPPMNIRVRDHRQFGRKPMVGVHVIKCLDDYRTEPIGESYDALAKFPALLNAHSAARPMTSRTDTAEVNMRVKIDVSQIDEDIDWWSKYYASTRDFAKCRKYVDMGYDTMKIYSTALESAESFNNFKDFCGTFGFLRGKNLDDDEDGNIVGEFKGSFCIYPLPEDLGEPLPPRQLSQGSCDPSPVDCTVRLYVIKSFDLQPNDPSGLADPYVEVELGKKKMDSKEKYIPNTLNPVFGQIFELKCILPIDKDLYIRVKDYDFLSSDDVIGETVIDLENRYLSKFNARVGLPQSYYIEGPNQWRDVRKPIEILTEFCANNLLPQPIFDGSDCLRLGSKCFYLDTFEPDRKSNPHYGPENERLALHVLNCLPLVKEHVETRPLYSPLQPGIEQGKLQCWVDIFPSSAGPLPPPTDVRPREPKKFELRVIVWNTKDVILEETSITGEQMSDIYVRGWLAGIDEKQETDVHYRSLDGVGNFNWRFKFPIDYLPAENVMVVKKKEHFWSLDATEQCIPPNLVVQIWDNDKFSADDFLGTLELNLSSMPAPKKKSRQCGVEQLPAYGKSVKMINLFECKRAYGYWPCINDEKPEDDRLTGKVEMELELLTAEEAQLRPAGFGQDEPNENPHLDPPKRPETSFLWFASPWKTFKHIVWKRYKWYLIGLLLLIVFGLLLAVFIYAVPSLAARKMMGV